MITGAGGAIGIHVLAYILEKTDWHIIAVDSFRGEHKGYFDRIASITELVDPVVLEGHISSRLSIFVHDLCAPFTAREVRKIGDIDYIINLASRSDVRESEEDPVGFVRNNTELMLTMLEYAREVTPSVFLHFSTDEVYGPAEANSGGHREWSPILPSNAYSASKAAQEALAIAWWRSWGVPLVLTNTMNNFGEMQAPSKFPAMIQKKIEAGETIDVHAADDGTIGTRYYIHSRNVADALVYILQNIPPKMHGAGEIDRPTRLNIVGDKQISNQALVEMISELMDKPAQVQLLNFHDRHPGHDLHYGLNGEELSSLGWKSPEPLEVGLKRTIEWQKAHPEWMK